MIVSHTVMHSSVAAVREALFLPPLLGGQVTKTCNITDLVLGVARGGRVCLVTCMQAVVGTCSLNISPAD